MPELVRENRSFAPRGAALPSGLPDLQAEVSRKSDVWAYNVEGYYEEAMSRQWNTTTDIPWAHLEKTELPEAIGKAYAQLLTFLTEVEMTCDSVVVIDRGQVVEEGTLANVRQKHKNQSLEEIFVRLTGQEGI